MILEIDAGNTALKWRVVDANGDVRTEGRSSLSADNLFARLAVEFPCLQKARLSCVANTDIRTGLVEAVFDSWGARTQLAETQKLFAGLTIAYSDPSRLGVDRWLAMLAARREVTGPVCVFDCGSAVTVDLVEGNGKHRGGYIVPGLNMQRNTLLSSTGQIRIEHAVDYQHGAWGCSTEEAVSFGVARMVAGFVDTIAAELLASDAPPTLLLTGGDADLLLPLLENAALFEVRPALVMDGLAIALP